MGQKWPNCDPEISTYVENVINIFNRILSRNLAAVYLHGSLAMGSFYPPKSDIDILAVVTRKLTSSEKRRIIKAILDTPHYRQSTENPLEISFILQEAAAKPSHPMPFELHYSSSHTQAILEGTFDYKSENLTDEDLGAHMHVAREKGISLQGPDPKVVLGKIPLEMYHRSVQADIEWILRDENICESPVYGILNLCRYLHDRQSDSGTVISKDEAALWALEYVPDIHKPVIGEVLQAYRSKDPVFDKKQRQRAGRDWNKKDLLNFSRYVGQLYPVPVLAESSR